MLRLHVASTSNEITLVGDHMKSDLLPTGIMPELRQSNSDCHSTNSYGLWSVISFDVMTACCSTLNGPRQANLLLIAYASSEGSGEPAHPRSLARTFAARSYKQWIKRNLQTESQIRGPSEWLGMRGWNLSWRNARRHKFAWRGSNERILSFNVTIACTSTSNKRFFHLMLRLLAHQHQIKDSFI